MSNVRSGKHEISKIVSICFPRHYHRHRYLLLQNDTLFAYAGNMITLLIISSTMKIVWRCMMICSMSKHEVVASMRYILIGNTQITNQNSYQACLSSMCQPMESAFRVGDWVLHLWSPSDKAHPLFCHVNPHNSHRNWDDSSISQIYLKKYFTSTLWNYDCTVNYLSSWKRNTNTPSSTGHPPRLAFLRVLPHED